MDPHKRFFGYCANQRRIAPAKYEVVADTGRLLRSLILFDHVTLHSLRLREFRGFAEDLGFEAMIELLRSNAIRIFPDTVAFAGPVKLAGHANPVKEIGITLLNHPRALSLATDFPKLRQSWPISARQFSIFEEAIHAALAPTIANYGREAEENTYRDLDANPEALKIAVASDLRRAYRFAIKPNDFDLQMRRVSHGVYHADTDLPALCHLPVEEIDERISMAMAALAELNLRIEEMRAHSSITAFDDEDLVMFENRIAFLLDRQNARDQEAAFRRVIDLLDLPEIPTGDFDAATFLRLREQSECAEFRRWLSETSDWSDGEITEHVRSLHQAVSRFYQQARGKFLRFLVSSGLGFLSTPAGLILSVGDTFLLDRVLKPSGAVTFIASDYPSLFGESK